MTFRDTQKITQDFENIGDRDQPFTLSKSVSTTKTSSWENTLGLKITVGAKGKYGVPFVSEGEVSLAVEASEAFKWGESTSKADTIQISVPLTVPPHQKYEAVAEIQPVSMSLDYTMTGEFHFRSGASVKGTVKGKYTSKNSYQASGWGGPILVDRIVGNYELDNPTNPSHHATITKRDDRTAEWKNYAGPAWTLKAKPFALSELEVESDPNYKTAEVLHNHGTVTGLFFAGVTYSRVDALHLPKPDLIAGAYEYEHAEKENGWHHVTVTKVDDATLEWKNHDKGTNPWILKTTGNPYELAVDCPYYPKLKTAAVLCNHGKVTGLKFGDGIYIHKG